MIKNPKHTVGKVGRKAIIKEAKIIYPDNKIEEFIQEASKYLNSANNIYKSGIARAEKVNIKDSIADLEPLKKLGSNLNTASTELYKLYDKYIGVVENYDYNNMPSNVKELEKIADEISSKTSKIESLADLIDDVITVINKFKSAHT